MTAPTLDAEPACPGTKRVLPPEPARPSPPARRLHVVRCSVAEISARDWDAVAARTPWATPFSRHAFHRAWWDGYGDNADDQTLAVLAAPPADEAAEPATPVAIVPLMRRHEVEPTDIATHTRIRADPRPPQTEVPPHATAVFFGATYHADYATILADPADLGDVTAALADYLAATPDDDDPSPTPWDVVDLRRLRCGDPAADALADAFGAREIANGWTLNVEREDVAPVTTLPAGTSLEDFLSILGKKVRHEIRRKIRRAESVGEVRLDISVDPLANLDDFVDLHQRRWGYAGLFPDTPGGAQSRTFARRLVEGFGPDGTLQLAFLTVRDRRIGAAIWFDDGESIYYYNAGVEPAARELSPGVLLVAKLVEHALALGRRRFDFLRGDEPYKYEWGAVDEPIQRLLVRRTDSRPPVMI